MSARKPAQRLQLECSASTWLRVLFFFIVSFSQLSIVLLPLPFSLKLYSILLITALAWSCWHRRSELGASATILTWDADGRWWWLQEGVESELLLCGDSYLVAGMVILNFSRPESGRRRSLVLLPDSVGEAAFRRLRVRLMLEGRRCAADGDGLVALLKAKYARWRSKGGNADFPD